LGLAPVASARDLVVTRSATDRIVLDDRRADVNGGADRLRFADGKSLSVAALVQAMAAFGTPAGGERSLARADVQQYLTPLLAPGAQGAPGKAGRRGLAQRGYQPDSPPQRASAAGCPWSFACTGRKWHAPPPHFRHRTGPVVTTRQTPHPTKPVARAR
jgi:hypothetical protein